MSKSASGRSEGRVHRNLFFLLVALVTAVFFGMIGPFLLTILWAVVLSIIFYGLYRRIAKWLGPNRGGYAAGITCVLVFLFGVVPLILLSLSLISQASELYAAVESGELDVNVVIDYVETELPRLAGFLEGYGVNVDNVRENVTTAAGQVGQVALSGGLAITGNIINTFVQFTLMLYLLYFFLKDGRMIVQRLISTVPLGNVRERLLIRRFVQVSRATLKGTVIVAVTQGAIGGILFWIVGIQAPLLWGVAMTLLALLPVGGSAIVWVPAAIILFIQGEILNAVVIVVVGSLIIGLVDNLLRPILVGRDTQMPDYLVLISTLGGIAYFGLSGFVIGPTVAALFITVWEMMGTEFGGRSS